MAENRPKLSEDWLAVGIGLGIFTLSLGMLIGVDLLGWSVKTQVWLQLSKALSPVSAAYVQWGGVCRTVGDVPFSVDDNHTRRCGAAS